MLKNRPSHLGTVLQALFVTFLWATSWVFIKIGLVDIPALTFAGLRYCLAFLCLLPFALRSPHVTSLRHLPGRDWLRLVALGLVFYTLTQGAQFLGLAYLPAITVNLLLSFTIVVVMLLGIVFLAERPTRLQWGGVGLYLAGAIVFFYPASFPASQIFGLVVVLIGVLANAVSAILGRFVNRAGNITPLAVTVVSMGAGAAALMATGLVRQGLPQLGLLNWAIIGWLAVVNTALAFTLWNHTMRILSATESSIINNTMMIQIPLLALLFLGEQLTWREGIGMVLAGIGIILVQLQRFITGLD
ncbi:MAG: DMT family transporter [Anaerolineae bacterium]|nr:DMT family transporter [Anaerolineae bacterium]